MNDYYLNYKKETSTLKISYENSIIDIPENNEIRLRLGTYNDLIKMFFKVFFESDDKRIIHLNRTILVDCINYKIKYIRNDEPPVWWHEFQNYFNRYMALRTFW